MTQCHAKSTFTIQKIILFLFRFLLLIWGRQGKMPSLFMKRRWALEPRRLLSVALKLLRTWMLLDTQSQSQMFCRSVKPVLKASRYLSSVDDMDPVGSALCVALSIRSEFLYVFKTVGTYHHMQVVTFKCKSFLQSQNIPICFQVFPDVEHIKLESNDLGAVKLDPDLGVHYETVEDVR